MKYNKTLRWLEPWGGYSPNDTGLCNRIFHWTIAYELNRRNNFQFKIILDGDMWPELSLIELPNTVGINGFDGINHNLREMMLITHFDLENKKAEVAQPLTRDGLLGMCKNDNYDLSEHNHWYSDFGFLSYIKEFDINIENVKIGDLVKNGGIFIDNKVGDAMRVINKIELPNNKIKLICRDNNTIIKSRGSLIHYCILNKSPISERQKKIEHISSIKLRHPYLDHKIRTEISDAIGIHIRKGTGCNLDSITDKKNNHFWKKYVNFKNKIKNEEMMGESNIFPYIDNEKYFKIIENVLKKNPNQKIYISSDLPSDFIDTFTRKYGHKNIKTVYSILLDVYNFFKKKDVHLLTTNTNKEPIKEIIDLFSLANCKYFIKMPNSSWSTFAQLYNNIPSINITEDTDKIINHTLEYVKRVDKKESKLI